MPSVIALVNLLRILFANLIDLYHILSITINYHLTCKFIYYFAWVTAHELKSRIILSRKHLLSQFIAQFAKFIACKKKPFKINKINTIDHTNRNR